MVTQGQIYNREHVHRSRFLWPAIVQFQGATSPNSYKEGKTPWQLAREKKPQLPIEIPMIPPVFIDDLMDHKPSFILKGGHDVPSTPWSGQIVIEKGLIPCYTLPAFT